MRIQIASHARDGGHCTILLNDQRVRKPRFHLPQKLRREIDFRHQHQRLAALRQGVRDQMQIDLGFAAGGDAKQQEWREGAARGNNYPDSAALLIGKHRAGRNVRDMRATDGRVMRQRRHDDPAFF